MPPRTPTAASASVSVRVRRRCRGSGLSSRMPRSTSSLPTCARRKRAADSHSHSQLCLGLRFNRFTFPWSR